MPAGRRSEIADEHWPASASFDLMRLLSGEGSDCWLCHRRRLHAALVRGGEQAREELVRQLMRELGLVACQPAPWRPQTTQ